jgi:Mg2+/Co2+ transporter CorB
MPKKHRSILVNLFDLGSVTVQDVMLPRSQIEMITLEQAMEDVARELGHRRTTCRLPVFQQPRGRPDRHPAPA